MCSLYDTGLTQAIWKAAISISSIKPFIKDGYFPREMEREEMRKRNVG